jgi:enoyl-CoA hydratase
MAAHVLLDSPADAPGVTVLTLNRPEKLNAMDAALVTELHEALDEAGRRPDCRVIVLTGAGRGFCAGLDLGGYGPAPATGHGDGRVQQGFAVQQQIAALIPRLRRLRQPVIAAVNGAASGGGFALVLGSDIRLAARSAKFNAAFVRIGLSACDIGTSWLLPRLIGAAPAQELMLTGRLFDAGEAHRLGLVVDVVDDDSLVDRALESAALICRNTPFGVQMTKEVMWSALEVPGLQAAIDLENRTQIMTSFTEDHREAMAAFAQKREPEFRNR